MGGQELIYEFLYDGGSFGTGYCVGMLLVLTFTFRAAAMVAFAQLQTWRSMDEG